MVCVVEGVTKSQTLEDDSRPSKRWKQVVEVWERNDVIYRIGKEELAGEATEGSARMQMRGSTKLHVHKLGKGGSSEEVTSKWILVAF